MHLKQSQTIKNSESDVENAQRILLPVYSLHIGIGVSIGPLACYRKIQLSNDELNMADIDVFHHFSYYHS